MALYYTFVYGIINPRWFIMTNFKKYLIENEKSRNTVDKYVRDASAFCAWLGDFELTKEKVLEYKEDITQMQMSPAS